MTITIEELRKVYEEAMFSFHEKNGKGAGGSHDASILAVARYVAERQRAVEPTEEMEKIGYMQKDLATSFRAMQSVAPLVVPE